MARILVVDYDPDIALKVEASLESAGHRVFTTTSSGNVLPLAIEEDIDAVVLDLRMPGLSGHEVLRALRSDKATARLPVLLLASAGVSSRPDDPIPLNLRLERLLAPPEASQDLEGDFGQYPFWELLQMLQLGHHSGRLELLDHAAPAWLEVHLGALKSGVFGLLTGREAALAMADLAQGRFRFTAAGPDTADTASGLEISLGGLLLEAAFLIDELRRLRPFVPGPRSLLNAAERPLPSLPESFDAIPVTATYLRVLQQAGTSLEKLLKVLAVAPQKVEIAVAWLLEQGLLITAGALESGGANAVEDEDDAQRQVHDAIRRLVLAAREAGRSSEHVHVLLLGQEASWPTLRRLIAGAAEDLDETGWGRLGRQLELRRGGSAQLDAEGTQLSVHAQLLTPDTQGRVSAILPLCTAVVVWLGDAETFADVEPLIERLERSERAQTGLLVAPDEAAEARAREGLGGRERWKLTGLSPATLGQLLELL